MDKTPAVQPAGPTKPGEGPPRQSPYPFLLLWFVIPLVVFLVLAYFLG